MHKIFKNKAQGCSTPLILIGSAMFGATFNLVTRVDKRIFGTLKGGRLQINSLVLNNCFTYRKVFKYGFNALSKMVLKSPLFVKKLKILCSLDHFVNISPACTPKRHFGRRFVTTETMF